MRSSAREVVPTTALFHNQQEVLAVTLTICPQHRTFDRLLIYTGCGYSRTCCCSICALYEKLASHYTLITETVVGCAEAASMIMICHHLFTGDP